MISFGQGFSEYHVTPFPSTSCKSVPLVAPLWADFNFRKVGNVFFRSVTEDNATLERAKKIINYQGFSPSLCVIVTWVNAVLVSKILPDYKVCTVPLKNF